MSRRSLKTVIALHDNKTGICHPTGLIGLANEDENIIYLKSVSNSPQILVILKSPWNS